MKRRYRNILIFLFAAVLTMTCSTAVFAMAEDSFRDGEVEMTFPDETTYGDGEEKAHIGYADIPVGSGQTLHMDIYYSKYNETEDYVYFNGNETDADDYFEKWGKKAIEEQVEKLYDGNVDVLSLEKDEFYVGEYVSFIRTVVQLEDTNLDKQFNQVVYLTANSVDFNWIVNKMIFFSERGGSYENTDAYKDIQESILAEFYDYYDDTFAGTGPEFAEPDGNGDTFESELDSIAGVILKAFGILFAIAVIRIAYAIIKNRKGSGDTHKHMARPAKMDGSRLKPRRGRNKTAREDDGEKLCGDFVPETDAEQRYYQSLQTLKKSGLLTKAEMDEMLEKHAEIKSRQRK